MPRRKKPVEDLEVEASTVDESDELPYTEEHDTEEHDMEEHDMEEHDMEPSLELEEPEFDVEYVTDLDDELVLEPEVDDKTEPEFKTLVENKESVQEKTEQPVSIPRKSVKHSKRNSLRFQR